MTDLHHTLSLLATKSATSVVARSRFASSALNAALLKRLPVHRDLKTHFQLIWFLNQYPHGNLPGVALKIFGAKVFYTQIWLRHWMELE